MDSAVAGPPSTEAQMPMLSPSGNLLSLSGQQSSPSPQPMLSSTLGSAPQQQQQQQSNLPCSPTARPSSSTGDGGSTLLHLTTARPSRESPHSMQLDSAPSDPVVGAPPASPVNPVNNGNRPIRVNGNNNSIIRNPTESLDEPGNAFN